MENRWILQFCHSHYGPFLDVARQYSALFQSTGYKVLTVYLTGEDTPLAREGSASDDVLFMALGSRDVRNLKLGAIKKLKAILATRQCELIIAHRFKPIYVACLASKLPIIGVHHAFGDYQRLSRRFFAKAFQKRLTLLGVSNAVRDDIRRALPTWPNEKIETLYNRIDIEAVRNGQLGRRMARDALALPQEAFIVGNVGRLHPDKDQATLIRGFAQALPKLPEAACLAIMGTGKLEESLRRTAAEAGITDKVIFLGQVKNGRQYFKAFDVFALSSDHEPFGMVLLEAMAAELPIIASRCGGAPEIVRNPAHLFSLGNATDLADKLITVANSNALPDQGNELLCSLFSDEAARLHFFQLPATRHLSLNPLRAAEN